MWFEPIMPIFLWTFLIGFFFPVYFAIMLPLIIWRQIVNLIVYLFVPDLVEDLNSRDLIFASDDPYGKTRKGIVNVTIISGQVTLDTFRQEFDKRLLKHPENYKFNCIPTTFLGYWFWKKAKSDVSVQITEIPGVHPDDYLKEYLPNYVQEGFVKGQTLWEAQLITLTGNRTAIIIKYHHYIGDGVSFMRVLEHYSDGGYSRLDLPDTKPFALLHWMYAWYYFPWKCLYFYYLSKTMKGFRPKGFYGESFTSWTVLPLEKIRVLRRSYHCLFSSVLAGLLSTSFNRLLEKHPKLKKSAGDGRLRIILPAPWPNRKKGTTSNHVAWIHSETALSSDMEPIIKNFERTTKESYKCGLHGIIWQTFRGLYVLPRPLLRAYSIFGETNIPPVILSSVPGSLTPVTLFGHKIHATFPVLANGCSTGLNFCVTTYAEGAYFSLRVSNEILPSIELLEELLVYLDEELDKCYMKILKEEKSKNNNEYTKIAMPSEKA